MAVFVAYFDDSHRFDHPSGGVLAIAGYVAPLQLWDSQFDSAWRSVLGKAPHAITEFKASDCRNGWDEFSGWSKDERIELTKSLVSVITAAPRNLMFGLGSAIELPYVEDFEVRKHVHGFAYVMCVCRVVLATYQWSRLISPDHEIDFVFDSQPGLMGSALEVMQRLQEVYQPRFNFRIRLPTFAHSIDVAPLQAADLLAYETYKELFNRLSPEPRPISKALERLTRHRLHYGDFYEAKDVLSRASLDDWMPDIGDEQGRCVLPVLYDDTGVIRDQSKYQNLDKEE